MDDEKRKLYGSGACFGTDVKETNALQCGRRSPNEVPIEWLGELE